MRHITLFRILAVAATAVAVTACTASESSLDKRNELIARRAIAAWAGGDTTTIVHLFKPDAVYDDYPEQEQFQGVEDIVGHLTSLQSWATDISMDVGAVHTGPTSAVVEWTLSLVQNRPMGNLVPMATNKNVVINGITVYQIENGLITRAADYWDASELAIQLGGKVVFPGGATWPTGDTTTVGGGGS